MLRAIFGRAGDGFTESCRSVLRRTAPVAACGLHLIAGAATQGAALELPSYSDSVLAEWQQRYPRGILSNYREVILPRVDADARRVFEDVVFQFPMRIEGREPFAFAADSGNRVIYMSVQSLKFLDELSIAEAWLSRNGYSLESLFDYLLMLRNWQAQEPPPPVLPTLCVPDNVLDDQEVDLRAQRSFATAIFFVMLHELGHIYHGHGGYEGIDPSEARRNEADADAFAIAIMARVGDVPVGVVALFMTMAHLYENQEDFSSDDERELNLAARTHPLSADRLISFADALEASAGDFSASGLPADVLAATAGQLRIVAGDFMEIQRTAAVMDRPIRPGDLGPRRPGELLGNSCDAGAAADGVFSGRFVGTIVINDVEFDLLTEMARSGDQVRGQSSYGLGVSEFEGIVEGDTLHYQWRLGPNWGRGRLTFANGFYEGHWGNQDSDSNGGAMRLSSQ
jgi:hypothetical protein